MKPKRQYRPRAKVEGTCLVCEGDMTATRPDAVFCSAKCRQQASRARRHVTKYCPRSDYIRRRLESLK